VFLRGSFGLSNLASGLVCVTMAHSIPIGAFSRNLAASGKTPSTWKTLYELYDERRSVSSSSKSEAPSTTQDGPSSASVADTVNVRGIEIAGWKIESHKGSIADSKSIDERSEAWGIPLPEMPFDKNRLVLQYIGPDKTQPTWAYCLDGMSALRSVEGVNKEMAVRGISFESDSELSTGKASRSAALGQKPAKASKRVQVSYASEWGRKREQQSSLSGTPASQASGSNFGSDVAIAAATGNIATARDYDWTYTSTWPGDETSVGSNSLFKPAEDPRRDRIPVERLGPPSTPGAKAEPILFFDELILFEDELGDNGTSLLNVKVRVMPTGFLVLQRFFLRVDNVVFRVFDTRIYVSFYEDRNEENGVTSQAPVGHLAELSLSSSGSAPALVSPMRVIRECCGYQRSYSSVRARLPAYKPNDLSPLTEPGWVAQQLIMMAEQEQRKAASSANHPGTTVPIGHGDPTLPAVLPSRSVPGLESNRILGEVHSTPGEVDDKWEGEGGRIDVATII
jgi:type 2A phosphatase activator TIP41